MKRFAGLFLICLILIFMILTGCSAVNDTSDSSNSSTISPTKAPDDTSSNATPITDVPRDKVINVFSPTDEIPRMVMKYKELHPDFPYKIEMFTFYTIDRYFYSILDEYLAKGGVDIPDIYCIDSGEVLRYSQGDSVKYAAPYKDIGIDVDKLVKEADIAQYVIDMGTNSDGDIVGLAYQGTGGAFIYRRSIAKAVWGTDEPKIIKDKVGPGWEKFFEAAADLKAKGYGIVSGADDIWFSIENSAGMPWVVNGKLYIDPKREAFLDLAKQLKDNGYSNDTQYWSNDWYADIEGTGKKEILGFFGPSWLINYVLVDNCGGNKFGEGTYGDWAVCEPPSGFFWSGFWIFANKNSEHIETIGDIMEWITLDSSETGLQYSLANGTYDGSNGVLETVTSGTVMKKTVGKLDFLGNQNMFEVYDKATKLANGKNTTQYDTSINSYWREQVRHYTEGRKTREQAIADFKQDVKDNLGIE